MESYNMESYNMESYTVLISSSPTIITTGAIGEV
jgi:hypothetical protein